MEQDQIPHFGFARHLHSFQPARMSPTFPRRGQLFGRILRIVDQHIRAVRQLAQILIKLRDARLVVRRVNDRSPRRLHPVA